LGKVEGGVEQDDTKFREEYYNTMYTSLRFIYMKRRRDKRERLKKRAI